LGIVIQLDFWRKGRRFNLVCLEIGLECLMQVYKVAVPLVDHPLINVGWLVVNNTVPGEVN
jgi:hypothetical protein